MTNQRVPFRIFTKSGTLFVIFFPLTNLGAVERIPGSCYKIFDPEKYSAVITY